MLGYMTAKEALKEGFTHHGKCYGIPIWITDEECPMVCTKFAPFEYLIDTVQFIEFLLRQTVYPEDEPVFQFLIGGTIAPTNKDENG